ncbi:P-loop containing nucleoside triphosphate hydrolase protein [Phlyctochytrium arcticum]|nr:P-loop containing nucleoside triphosphate hydrolase protein [Phlyctochytrium arcticum]
MPCRDDEFYEIFGHVCEAVEEGCGSCIYISGVPGTGKTATVHAVIRHCQEAAKKEELINFHFVEINGMKLTDPQQAYSVLWESLTGQRIASQQAGGLLEKRFKEGASDGRPVVVLMDELDLLVTRNQTVMYNFFNWPTLPNSRLVVIAVANTMDLPERLLTNKVSSRLGLTRINFAPYTHDQLREIVTARLAGVQCFSKDAIEFCARKVGAVSGDARRALDICRRGVEILEIMLEEGPAVDALTIDKGRNKQVTMKVIDRAIKEMYTSPAVQAIMRAPLHHRIYLVALVRCIRRAGVPDVEHADVCDEYFRLCQFGSVTGLSWSDVGLIGWTLGDMKVLFREGGKVMERCARVRLHVGEEDVVAGVRGLEAESWLKRMVEE